MNRACFLGYPVDNVSEEDTLQWIRGSIKNAERRIIAVTNANKLWQAHKDPILSEFLKKADLVLPEYAVVWGAMRLGISLTHSGGFMVLKAFLPFAEKEQIRPYFLGAKPGVLEKMMARISLAYPGLPICGFHHGYFADGEPKMAIIDELRERRPDILFIAMGSPKQEYLMAELRERLSIPVMIGVGGSFDVISGDKKDAPSWVRGTGLEWIYRIYQDPLNFNYLKRYLITNTWFIWQILKQKIRQGQCRAN